MSGQFKNDGAQRITNSETLQIRSELINIIGKENIIKTKLRDQHGFQNLLLPNFIKEKDDNGDIDIFLYYDLKLTNPEKIVNVLKKDKNVLKINRIDKIWSFLFYSTEVNKKVQIDLHIIRNTQENLSNYFNYYRVSYLYFILGMILNKLNLKLGINGLFFGLGEKTLHYFMLERKYTTFLEKMFGFSIEETFEISSYSEIKDFLIKHGFSKYDFFNLKELRGDYQKKMRNNDKLANIINSLPDAEFPIEQYKIIFNEKLFKTYPYLQQKTKEIDEQIEKTKQEKKKRVENLEYLFDKRIQDFSKEQQKMISLISGNLEELVFLKNVSLRIKEKYPEKSIYLVGGAVRDILLGVKNKDWDITGNLSPEEFQGLFGGMITEKLGTVFSNIDGKFEVEYTPFRKEENYDGRKPQFVSFDTDLTGDSMRRDFTINSIYINLSTFEIIDLHGGIEDLKNKIVRTVGLPPDARFLEDYLRILRGIRLAAKIDGKIEENTYSAMIRHSNKIKELSDERVLEEIFKGFNLKENKSYILYLNDFGNDSQLFKDVLSTYKKLLPREIYSILYYISGFNIEKVKRIPGAYSGETKKAFVFIEKITKLQKFENLDFEDISNDKKEFLKFLFTFGFTNHSNKEVTKLLIIFFNIQILNGNFTRDKIKKVLTLKKELEKENIHYTKSGIVKKNDLDIEKLINEGKIDKTKVNDFLLSEILNQI